MLLVTSCLVRRPLSRLFQSIGMVPSTARIRNQQRGRDAVVICSAGALLAPLGCDQMSLGGVLMQDGVFVMGIDGHRPISFNTAIPDMGLRHRSKSVNILCGMPLI